MNYKKWIIAITLGISIGLYLRSQPSGTKSQGFVAKNYEKIRKLFDQVLKYEREGATVAVYEDNQLIVDLWGGYAERAAYRLWERNTLTIGFSTTKTIGAFVIAILVIKYWPEFGKHGKDNITIQWLVEHKAGLLRFDEELELSRGNDHEHISKLIEETKPLWPPGTQIGYHALTYGWLLDQIVRRVDPKKRGIGDFYRQEIQPLAKDKDYYIGLPRSEHYRFARIVQPTMNEFIKAILTHSFYTRFVWNNFINGYYFPNYMGLMGVSGNYPSWLTVLKWEMPYNNPAVQEIENIAVSGYGTARGFASVISAIINSNLISKEVWEIISKPTEYGIDGVAQIYAYRGHGFFYDPHPTRKNAYLMMHTGHGRQKVTIDPVKKIVAVLMRNGLSWHIGADSLTDLITKNVLVITEKH